MTNRFIKTLIISMLLVVSCKKDEKLTVSVESITLSQTNLELEEGKTAKLTAIVLPKEASNKSLTWASSDKTVATVDKGNITTIKEGNATITVTTEDEKKTAKCEVKVVSKQKLDSSDNGFIDSRDGTSYKEVKIGDQIWMAENLRYLPSVNKAKDDSATEAMYYVYDYDGTDVNETKKTENYKTYGVLYNWEAAKQSCPKGWHLPSNDEWKKLEMALGMSQSEADKVSWRGTNEGSKLAGNADLWKDSSLRMSSEFGKSGFNAIPGGSRAYHGSFENIGKRIDWWSATEKSTNNEEAHTRNLNYNYSKVFSAFNSKDHGFYVRCIRD